MIQVTDNKAAKRLPAWFKQDIPNMAKVSELKALLRNSKLNTVCESAHCPNMGQCWKSGVATFMILGNVCTRSCHFCAVPSGAPQAVDSQEPGRVAAAVQALNLSYVVITSVTRDDLPDGGADQFAQTIFQVRAKNPATKVEVLIPDFLNNEQSLKTVIQSKPDVISHNIETARRLYPCVRPQANYARSLQVLKQLKAWAPSIMIKSSFMVGLGETQREVICLMEDLLDNGCDMVTIGQYLAPTKGSRHIKVERFISPEEFKDYEKAGKRLGFKHVFSGPLVRSSYLAEEGYQQCLSQS